MTAIHLPFYVFGFCLGIIARPIVAGVLKGYFFLEVSELLKQLETAETDIDLLERAAEHLQNKHKVQQERQK